MSSQLERMREQVRENKPKKGRRKVWAEPTLADFAGGTVLSFDQSLTKCGWALVHCWWQPWRDEPIVEVMQGGVLRPEIGPSLRSFEQTYARAEELGRMLESGCIWLPPWPFTVVHEMPAVAGYRLESSLMAGREVRRVFGEVKMISRQRAYSNLVGAPSVEKAKGTATVNRLIPKRRRKECRRWNQDVHDAVLLALQHLHERKRSDD